MKLREREAIAKAKAKEIEKQLRQLDDVDAIK
jgi:hypothetical protein